MTWRAYIGTSTSTEGITMKENVPDSYIKTDATEQSMENLTTYKGIYFGNITNMLGEDGYIKVYDDETDILLETFNKNNVNKYSSSNPYRYDMPVKRIRIETSNTTNDTSLYVYHVKELDDEALVESYTQEKFENLQYIKSTLSGQVGDSSAIVRINQANYEAPISIATIGISKNTLSTQKTEENVKITIQTKCDESSNQVKWLNGAFLVKLPEEILDLEINGVTIDNTNVALTSYELVEQDGCKFIKILTSNTLEASYNITIDVNITPDPRKASATKAIELYASNENVSSYYYKGEDTYDVNNNLNTTEIINKTTTNISLVSPSSLLTNQIGSEYDDKGSVIVSPEIAEIKPQVGTVDEELTEKTAKIGIQLKNNYSSTISDVVILGKIPFEGNTYVLTGKDLGSEFTTKMVNTGIELPEEVASVAKVYYSENTNPSKDLTDESNAWKTADQVENWDNIKTFIIDLSEYVMPQGQELVFNYVIKIPNGLEYNKVAYSHHGVYFSLDTAEGKYKTQTEPNRIGFKIAEKYNLELIKYQTGKDKLIPGATYKIIEEGQTEGKTAITDINGTLTFENLYVEKTYLIEEIKVPTDYELNTSVIKFVGHVDGSTLTIEKLEGETREDIGVNKLEGEEYKAIVKVEDEAKARLKVTKKEQDTDTVIKGVKFKITGEGISTTGIIKTTNSNGEISLSGLKINSEYTLQEVGATGYYVNSEQVKFKIVNNDGNYELQILSGSVRENSITEEDSIPTINMTIDNEKIPTYDLEIVKIKKILDVNVSEDEEGATEDNGTEESTEEITYLQGAKFSLYKDGKKIGEYVTGEDGKVTITNLYQYVNGKSEEATYMLKETLAPDGYAKVKDITFKVQAEDGTLKFINTNGEEEKYTVEGNTVKLTIEDSPSFKLIKKDGETGELLANVKFAIYNVDDGQVPATNSKGEILGTKEVIDGKEYYTLTTDQNGEITADLTEGLYKAVELQAPDKYDIENSTYYFGIGVSRKGKKSAKAEWAKGIGGRSYDSINSVAETADGGYVVGGYFESSSIDLGNGVTLESNGSSDGMIIRYGSEGEVEWAKGIGGSSNEEINSVEVTSDGGYLVGGAFNSSSIDLGNGVTLSNNGKSDGMIIKYSASGEVKWAKGIGGSSYDGINPVVETSDGGYIVGGAFNSSSIELGKGVTLSNNGESDGMIIKYSEEGEVEWAKGIGGNSDDRINSVVEISDGNYIIGGNFNSSSIDLGNGETLTINGDSDVMIIKYSANGEAEWVKGIGGIDYDYINSIAATSDGGYAVGGYFCSSSIDLGNGVALINNNGGSSDGMIIKYSEEGEVEWAQGIGGSGNDYINSVAETTDGGYAVGGYFRSSSIDLGNGVTLNNNGSTSYSDGMIIKYSNNGEVEWAKGIEGSNNDYINSIAATSDGGCVVGGYFESSSIDLGNGVTLESNGSSDGMIIKISPTFEIPNAVVKQAKEIGGSNNDYINSVTGTSDGGYIVGGYFYSSSIDLGNGVTLSNSGSSDGMIIKYSASGEVEWAKGIGGSSSEVIYSVAETSDGGYVVGGYFHSSIDLGNGVSLTNKSNINYGSTYYSDGMIIKYSNEGEVEWAKGIGGSDYDYINSVAETSDGGYIVGGRFYSSSIELGNGVILTNKSSSTNYPDGMIIKYNSSGETEWAKGIGGSNYDYINSVAETSDGGYIVGGYFSSSSIDLENGETLTSNGNADGMIIKYSKEGEVEWAKGIGGSSSDHINSVAETTDGGYIVGGYFNSSSIDLGNGVTLSNNGEPDGMIIKYSEEGEVEWAKGIGGSDYDYIKSVAVTSDGGYIIGGDFLSSSIGLGIETIINSGSTSYTDGMIIKYSEEGEVEWAKGIGGNSNDQINSVAVTSDGNYIIGGNFNSSSIDLENGETLTSNGDDDGMIMKLTVQMGSPEVQELVVENTRKEYRITTDIQEIDGIKGGTISGEDKNSYEIVKYGDSNTKEVIMTPDENYEIISITVNENDYQFTTNEDGTYTMPPLENITEDKHIVVTYALKDNKIVINKIDSETREPLTGAKFRLDQIEEREVPENTIEELTDNGQEYYEADTTKEITNVLGSLTNNGTYYFVKENGTYVPTNSKTYQVANGGTAGKGNTTANSYISIDLSDYTGKYVVVVNEKVSSEKNYDYGYATITENTTAPAYNSITGQFVKISGTSVTTDEDYTSMVLEGGKTYYLHLGYRKDGSGDTGEDRIIINSVKVYGTINKTYNFIENNGVYESTNQGKDNTVANSYIPIDLTNCEGKYNIIVNANISSQSGDYGYATITETTDRPAYNSSTGRFIYISGTTESVTTPTDYTTVLEGGKLYYLHLGYYKNASTSTGDDKFTVNSVTVTPNGDHLYHSDEITANSNGQAITQIPFGKYSITETQAPEGYELNDNSIVVEFRADGEHEFTIENKKESRVIVHHYIKDTTTKLVEDKIQVGKEGENYTTAPNLDISGYTLEQDTDGNYIIPENAIGTYQSGDQEVTYYYVPQKVKLTVHHYIEGTETPVPLKDGTIAEDIVTEGTKGENYTTQAINPDELAEWYSLVEVPENATGTYQEGEIVVTYYYSQRTGEVIAHHYIKDTTTKLSKDVNKIGAVGSTYETEPATDIP